MTDNPPELPPNFVDRKATLSVFGALHIVIGGICALLLPLVIASSLILRAVPQGQAEAPDTHTLAMTILFYGLAAVYFIWVGIGSIQARRWARALITAGSWMSLTFGTVGFLASLLYMPPMYAHMARTGQIPSAAAGIATVLVLLLMAVIYVVLPATIAIVYTHRNMRLTCETRDPQRRWTDLTPLPVLALSMCCAVFSVSILLSTFYGVVPCFGVLAKGPAAVAFSLTASVLGAFLAVGIFKRMRVAWMATLVLILVLGTSAIVTYLNVNMMELYAAIRISPKQLKMMAGMEDIMAPSRWIPWLTLLMTVAVGYMIYVLKYFKTEVGDSGDTRTVSGD